MNRQKVLLFSLLVALVLAIIWGYARMPRQKSVAVLKNVPGQQAAPGGRNTSRPAVTARGYHGRDTLRLDLLDRVPPDFKGYRRNLFKPVFVDEIKQAKLRLAAVKLRPPPPPPPPPPPLVPAITEAPRRELAKFTFLGFLLKDMRRTVFLSKDKEIILVKKGDTFAGRYEASSITEQALTIRVTDTGEEIVIPLVEYASLRPAR